MNKRVLFIDDDENILSSYRRNLRRDFDIETASGPEEGLTMIAAASSNPFAVIVSDLKMPKMSGQEVLVRAKKLSPHTVRVMLTGFAEIDTAIAAINEGSIFRFLTKPCSAEQLKQTLDACCDQYHLIMAEKELLRGTLQGSIRMLVNILAMTSPQVFGRCENVKKLVSGILAVIKTESAWQIEVAAMLAYLGYIAFPDSMTEKLMKGSELSQSELEIYDAYPENGAKLLSNIPRLEGVAELLRRQRDLIKGTERQPMPVRILNIALEYLETEQSLNSYSAMAAIKNKAALYGTDLITALQSAVGPDAKYALRALRISQLKDRMILDQDVTTVDNLLLLKKGQELSEVMIMRLVNYGKSCGVKEPIKVLEMTVNEQ